MTLDTRKSSTRTLPWPALIPVGQLAGKPAIPLARPVTLVGSRHSANLRISSSTVSKAHVLVINSDGRLLIRDLASRMGTIVNGQAVREADLSEGDVVQIGRFSFKFTAGPPSRAPRRKRRVIGARIDADTGESVPLDQRVVLVGQRGNSDLPINDPDVSTAHCAIFDMNGKRYVRDLGSRTGTFVNDQAAVQMEIRPGDTIRVGQTVLRYVPDETVQVPEDMAPPRPQPRLEAAASGPGNNGHESTAAIPLELDDLPALGSAPEAEAPAHEPLPLTEAEELAEAPALEEEATTTWNTPAAGEAHVVNVEHPEPEAVDFAAGPTPAESAQVQERAAEEILTPESAPETAPESIAAETTEPAAQEEAQEDAAFDFLMEQKPAAPAEPAAQEPAAEAEKAATAEETWTSGGGEVATPDVVALDLPLETGVTEEVAPTETPIEPGGEALEDLPFGDGEPVDAVEAPEVQAEAPVIPVHEAQETVIERASETGETIAFSPEVEEAAIEEPAAPAPVVGERTVEQEPAVVNEAPAEEPLAWAPEPLAEAPDEALVQTRAEAVEQPSEAAPEVAEEQEEQREQPVEQVEEPEDRFVPAWQPPGIAEGQAEAQEEQAESYQAPQEPAWQPETEEFEGPAPAPQEIASEDVLAVFEVNEEVSVEDVEEEEEPLDLSLPEQEPADQVATTSEDVAEPQAATTDSTTDSTTSSARTDWYPRIAENAPTVAAEEVSAAAPGAEPPPFEFPELDAEPDAELDAEPAPAEAMGETAVQEIEEAENTREAAVEAEHEADVTEPVTSAPAVVEAEREADVTEALAWAPEAVEPPAPEIPAAPAAPARPSGREYLLGEDPPLAVDPSAAPPESARALKIQFFTTPQSVTTRTPPAGLVTMTLPGMLPTMPGPSLQSGGGSKVVPATTPAAPAAPAKPQFQVVSGAPTKTITITPQQYAEPRAADTLAVEPRTAPSGPPPQIVTGSQILKAPAAGAATVQPTPVQPAPPVLMPPRPTNLAPSARSAEFRRVQATSVSDDVIIGVATGTAGNVRIEPLEGASAFGTAGSATSTPIDESRDVFSIGASSLFSGPPAEPQLKVSPIPEFTPAPPRPSRARGPVIPPRVSEWEAPGRAATAPAEPTSPSAPAAPQGASVSAAPPLPPAEPPAPQPAPPRRSPNEPPPPPDEDWIDDEHMTASPAEQRMLLGAAPRARKSARPRRNRRERILLLVAMVVAMIGAAYAVWKIFIPKVIAEGVIVFDHVGNLPADEQRSFEQRQLAIFSNPELRQAAQRILQKDKPIVSAGFLTDPSAAPTLESSLKIDEDNKQGALRVRLNNGDDDDRHRLMALLQAVYAAQDNNPMRATATNRQRVLQARRDALALEQARVTALRNHEAALKPDVDNRPKPEELKAAEQAKEQAKEAWTSAQISRRAIEQELRKLQASPGAGAAAPGDADDAVLRKLTGDLNVLNARIADAKAATAKAAVDARKAMTGAMDQFQASLTAAQGLLKDNPALKEYITSAQKLQETSWKLQNDLIDRQEKLRQRLVDRRKRYEEMVQQRNAKLIEQDPDLRELAHILEQKQRELTAAQKANQAKDVVRLQGDVDQVRGQIAERKLTLGTDELFEALLNDLKTDIEATGTQLEKDRTESEKMLLAAEAAFRKASPQVADLPKGKEGLAGQLSGNVQTLQAARKAYTDALKAEDEQANEQLKQLQTEATTVQEAIDARRRELGTAQQKQMPEQQQAAVKQKEAELAAASDNVQKLQGEFDRLERKFQELNDREVAYTRAQKELAAMKGPLGELTKAEAGVIRRRRQVDLAQDELKRAVIPREPTVMILDKADNRGLYMSGAMGGVALLFGVFMVAGGSGRNEGDSEEMGEEARLA